MSNMCMLTWNSTNKSLKKQEEAASKRTITETTKKCPGCKRGIEKSYGCDHMTCKFLLFSSYSRTPRLYHVHSLIFLQDMDLIISFSHPSATNDPRTDNDTCTGSKCRHQFCYQCLAPYQKKGERRVTHREGCEYYEYERD
jgi:hypothetical protein